MEIQIFKNEMFGEVRIMVNEKGEPFFVGSDVAVVLGYSDPQKAVKMHVDDDDKLTRRIVVSGQNRNAIIINESGLYALVLSSKLPQAKAFKRWVTNEVLPQIRQTGGYLPTRNARTGEMLDITANILNHFLVDKGIQYWNGSRYKLTAKYSDCGYAEERQFYYYALNGDKKQRAYMVWTPQGKEFIKSLFN